MAGKPWQAGDVPSGGSGFSSVIRAGDLVFVSALTACAEDAGDFARRGVRDQAEGVFDRLTAALDAEGATLDDLVELTSFHRDVREIADVYDVARPRFGGGLPAWTPVPASALPVPGARLSVRAVAATGGEHRAGVVPDTIAWWRGLPSVAGRRCGDLAWIAGLYGSDADGEVNTPGDHRGQAQNALNRMIETVRALGGEPEDLLALYSRHQDPRGIAASAPAVEGEALSASQRPPWSAAGVPALLTLGMLGQYRGLADLTPGKRIFARDTTGAALAARKASGSVIAATARPAVDDRRIPVAPGLAEQTNSMVECLSQALGQLGATLDDLVDVVVLGPDPHAGSLLQEFVERLPADTGPAGSAITVTGLEDEGVLIGVEALALTR